jgi:hypothetical protein
MEAVSCEKVTNAIKNAITKKECFIYTNYYLDKAKNYI